MINLAATRTDKPYGNKTLRPQWVAGPLFCCNGIAIKRGSEGKESVSGDGKYEINLGKEIRRYLILLEMLAHLFRWFT